MFQKALKAIDLSKNEAVIYELLLNHNKAHVSFIAKEGNINRRNVYDSLNRLIEQGLVFKIFSSNENHYSAVHPSKVLEKIESKRRLVQNALPEMINSFESTPHDHEVFIFEGTEGLKNTFKNMIDSKDIIRGFNVVGLWNVSGLETELNDFVERSCRADITFKFIFNNSAKDKISEYQKLVNLDYKILPSNYDQSAITSIYGDYIQLNSRPVTLKKTEDLTSETYTIIKNRSISESYKQWFDFIWSRM